MVAAAAANREQARGDGGRCSRRWEVGSVLVRGVEGERRRSAGRREGELRWRASRRAYGAAGQVQTPAVREPLSGFPLPILASRRKGKALESMVVAALEPHPSQGDRHIFRAKKRRAGEAGIGGRRTWYKLGINETATSCMGNGHGYGLPSAPAARIATCKH